MDAQQSSPRRGPAQAAHGNSTTFTAPGGQVTGRASGNGNSTTFTAPGGQVTGRANTHGNTTTFTGPGGQVTGRASGNGNSTTFTGPGGQVTGRASGNGSNYSPFSSSPGMSSGVRLPTATTRPPLVLTACRPAGPAIADRVATESENGASNFILG